MRSGNESEFSRKIPGPQAPSELVERQQACIVLRGQD